MMVEEEVVAIVTVDGGVTESASPFVQCIGCGRYVDRVCSVCPPREEASAAAHDPYAYERRREQIQRENRVAAARHGERT